MDVFEEKELKISLEEKCLEWEIESIKESILSTMGENPSVLKALS